jgi:DNA-cytosine methyltransferase
MNVLSLFDGMSCGQVALEKAGFKVSNYFASEIDKHAIKVAKANYPKTVHVGDVRGIKNIKNIDLLIGGSPCQGFSFAGKNLNFDDPRSVLFFEFERILKESKPKYFLLENVRMKQEHQDVITKCLGVDPILINSSLVSAQNRERLYWTNIPNIEQPADKKILLEDILDFSVKGGDECYGAKFKKENIDFNSDKNQIYRKPKHQQHTVNTKKSKCLSASETGRYYIYHPKLEGVRSLTPNEAEKLQNIPKDYTAHVSKTQRFRMLGNGWTVDVITHIISNMKF